MKKILLEMGNSEIGAYHCKEVEVPVDISDEEILKLEREFVQEVIRQGCDVNDAYLKSRTGGF